MLRSGFVRTHFLIDTKSTIAGRTFKIVLRPLCNMTDCCVFVLFFMHFPFSNFTERWQKWLCHGVEGFVSSLTSLWL